MEEKYFDTLEECKEFHHKDVEILLEDTVHKHSSGDPSIYHSLVKKGDKYAMLVYGKVVNRQHFGKWYASHKDLMCREYRSIESLMMYLCKSYFREEHIRISKLSIN